MAPILPFQADINLSVMNTREKIIPNENSILIFLVDDDELYLKFLEHQFQENSGPAIRTFLTGEDCLQNISLKPDIIVLDYFLNTVNNNAIDGLKTLEKIKAASPGIHVIMSSAYSGADVAVNCIKLGAFDYIVKNDETFSKLKQSIKKIFSIYSKEKELIVWDW